MTEAEAREWLTGRFGVEALGLLDRFVAMLIAENDQQNLVARSTIDSIYARHIVDSAQLLDHTPADGLWIDIGSGGGLPGIVIGCLRRVPMVLVEPRRRRAEFLSTVANQLGLDHVDVAKLAIEQLPFSQSASVVSARAVARPSNLFKMSDRFCGRSTLFALHRGQSGANDVADLSRTWHGMFHVEHSITDPQSMILLARGVSPK